MNYTLLLAVDGSDGSLRAARHVAYIAGAIQELKVHLLNVQPLGDDWMVRRMLKPEELATLEQDWGGAAMAPARAILQEAGIVCTDHIVQGEVAKTIVRLAEELACDQIVMGTWGRSALGDLFMGSVAAKVLHLARVPVTLVK
ncbi:MAG: universal stress protein [Gammaproteobacteria bacterium]|nr:universal stress protein [Gammaproteobacteria bacterium]